jgi:hypothetical protein
VLRRAPLQPHGHATPCEAQTGFGGGTLLAGEISLRIGDWPGFSEGGGFHGAQSALRKAAGQEGCQRTASDKPVKVFAASGAKPYRASQQESVNRLTDGTAIQD